MNKNVVIVFVFILFFFSSCTKDLLSEKEKNNRKFALEIYKEVKTIQKENDEKFENYLSNLSLEEKVSQLFIINLEGNKTFRAIDVLDGKPYVPGGYLFFSYNLSETFEEVKSFTDDIKNYCVKNNIIPPFLAVDEEGGYVQRLRKLAGKIPSEEEVAETMTVAEAYELYSFHAEKMREMGFHINLAPVSEVLSDYNKDFLDNRSFGDAVKTEQYSIAALNAYQNNGISCVIKHFPGNTNTDPHTGLPEIKMTSDEMKETLKPFKSVVSHNPEGVLMSHARTEITDGAFGDSSFSSEPSCFSSYWVTDVLRGEYGFSGIIFSDDIFMGALADNGYPPDVAAVKAIEAGVDCIMISEKRFLKPALTLIEKAKTDENFAKRIDESCRRILKYKIENGQLTIDNCSLIGCR